MSASDKNFMGLDSFVWWFGIVENRQDPLGLGRVQVRIYGWHTASLSDIPSENLPWASMVFSVNDRVFSTPREDDVVFGFFADGRSGQFPVVMGIVPGYFTQPPNTGEGFNDLRPQSTLVNAPKHPVSRTYNTDGSGITIGEANTANSQVLESLRHPNADELDQNSISGVTRYQNLANTVITARKTNLDKNIYSANNFRWSEPYPAFNPLYPYNQANETESGHVFELDDTPGSERIHIAHRSGSYVEWVPTGTKVEKITKSNYQIVMADDYLHVMGKVAITIDADCLIKCNGDVILEAGGKLSSNIAGDVNFSIGGGFNVFANSINLESQEDITLITNSGNIDLDSSGNLNLLSSEITAMQGNEVGISAQESVLIDDVEEINSGNAPQASGGSSVALPSAISGLVKNTGEAAPEEVPVPIPGPFYPNFDPETGTAYKQQLFLNPSANNTLIPPDSNTANIPTQNCNFDPASHTFISDPNTWAIGQAGLSLIKSAEGFAKVVSPDTVTSYPDPATGGEPLTIGYGTTAVAINQPVTLGELISRATAESYLETAINNEFLPTLRQTITVPLTQNMIDSILSLIYNIGAGNFTKSTLRKRINAQQWCAAGDAFLVWNKAAGKVLPGLTSRRQKERSLFLT